VCGLAIGVPREDPDLKPKQPIETVVFENRYPDSSTLVEDLVAYDKEISEYNRCRSGSTTENDWCAHILEYYRMALDYKMLDYLRKQGFNPKK